MAENFVYSAEPPGTAVAPPVLETVASKPAGPPGRPLGSSAPAVGPAASCHTASASTGPGAVANRHTPLTVRNGPCSRRPAWRRCFMFAKLQIILVMSPGRSPSSRLTSAGSWLSSGSPVCRGTAIFQRLWPPWGKGSSQLPWPSRVGCRVGTGPWPLAWNTQVLCKEELCAAPGCSHQGLRVPSQLVPLTLTRPSVFWGWLLFFLYMNAHSSFI